MSDCRERHLRIFISTISARFVTRRTGAMDRGKWWSWRRGRLRPSLMPYTNKLTWRCWCPIPCGSAAQAVVLARCAVADQSPSGRFHSAVPMPCRVRDVEPRLSKRPHTTRRLDRSEEPDIDRGKGWRLLKGPVRPGEEHEIQSARRSTKGTKLHEKAFSGKAKEDSQHGGTETFLSFKNNNTFPFRDSC
jgi:hypothetical protein